MFGLVCVVFGVCVCPYVLCCSVPCGVVCMCCCVARVFGSVVRGCVVVQVCGRSVVWLLAVWFSGWLDVRLCNVAVGVLAGCVVARL